MGENPGTRPARRARNRALGLCQNVARHGPAVRHNLCGACAEARDAVKRAASARYKQSGLCANAPSRGKATRGIICEACYRKRRKLCVFGSSHGIAVAGSWCAACAARRAAAAQRLAKRNAVAPKPARRKEPIFERVSRGGNIDSRDLWELLWRQQ